MTLLLRNATLDDVEFMIRVLARGEGYSPRPSHKQIKEDEIAQRQVIPRYICDSNKLAWVYEDTDVGHLVGFILSRFKTRDAALCDTDSVFGKLDSTLFPADGAFCQVFELWVAPALRRRGLATQMKLELEAECLRRNVRMIYTHTEVENQHVLDLNKKLGYHEVRRGPIWDSVVRVSLVKSL